MKLLPRKRPPHPGEDGGWAPAGTAGLPGLVIDSDAVMHDPDQMSVRTAWIAEYRRPSAPGSSIKIWVYVTYRADASRFRPRVRYQYAIGPKGRRRSCCAITHEGYFTPRDALDFTDREQAEEAAQREAIWFALAPGNEPQEDYPGLFDWDGSLQALFDRQVSAVRLVIGDPAGGESR